MNKKEYAEYLQSEHWQKVREEALEKGDSKCALCGSKPDKYDLDKNGDLCTLNVHHNTYDNIEHEQANDLVVLCSRCHDLYHHAVAHDPAYIEGLLKEFILAVKNIEEMEEPVSTSFKEAMTSGLIDAVVEQLHRHTYIRR